MQLEFQADLYSRFLRHAGYLKRGAPSIAQLFSTAVTREICGEHNGHMQQESSKGSAYAPAVTVFPFKILFVMLNLSIT